MLNRRSAAGTAVAVAAALAVAFSAVAALAASPTRNARFRGTASGLVQFTTPFKARDALSFSTSGDGRTLLNFVYADSACDLASSSEMRIGMIALRSDGSFALARHRSAPETPLMGGGMIVTTTTVTGRFVSPDTATGWLEYAQTGIRGSFARCGEIRLRFVARHP